MRTEVECSLASEDELDAAALVAREVFDEFVAPLYSQEGREEFHRFAATQALRERNQANHVTLIARDGNQIVGMLHLRERRHVAMLFVHREHQRNGVGRKLLNLAAQPCFSGGRLTVNSSPNAVEAYGRLGFFLIGSEQVVHGIRFSPMQLECPQRPVERCAPPNRGPEPHFDNSGGIEGPPSVS